MKKTLLAAAILAAGVSIDAAAAEPALGFEKLWTHGHGSSGQVSEIPAFDPRTNTIWVAGVVGVDVLDARTGELVKHIDVTADGLVNSVAIHDGLAALAVEAAPDRRSPGSVLFYDTRTRAPVAYNHKVTVGALPDMLTFTPDGSRVLVANEATPNAVADAPYDLANDPAGGVSIIDTATRTLITTAGFGGVPLTGEHLRTNAGMDFEPEYIAVNAEGTVAYVTVQEANAIGVLDLGASGFTQLVGLGAKDFNLPGNEIDPKDNDGKIEFVNVAAKGLYMPDSIAVYERDGKLFTVTANEGDYREDNVDRTAASSAPFNATGVLNRLRIVSTESAPGDLYAAGARSFSIRDAAGTLVYDSGSILDREAAARGIYDDGRSRDKGVEPEGVDLLKIDGRTYAFIGLERTTSAAIAVFDITVPARTFFVDMIVTPGDLAPEGLAAYKYKGVSYLAIANETVAGGQTKSHTTLYRIESARRGND